jgi:hypothetical protein
VWEALDTQVIPLGVFHVAPVSPKRFELLSTKEKKDG